MQDDEIVLPVILCHRVQTMIFLDGLISIFEKSKYNRGVASSSPIIGKVSISHDFSAYRAQINVRSFS